MYQHNSRKTIDKHLVIILISQSHIDKVSTTRVSQFIDKGRQCMIRLGSVNAGKKVEEMQTNQRSTFSLAKFVDKFEAAGKHDRPSSDVCFNVVCCLVGDNLSKGILYFDDVLYI